MKKTTKDIGLGVATPTQTCVDRHCAFHGTLAVHGRQFVCTITRMNAQKTAVVQWERLHYIPKYERYERRFSRLQVHNPSCLNCKVGDTVRILECRPISKTKSFVIIEKVQQ
ncbi:30S ribosomal protein S17 [Candidatus Woesearchaeota archaeon]|nr:30S ribosomal protein S17 [Candidatus Woesearchaeota archaeon]